MALIEHPVSSIEHPVSKDIKMKRIFPIALSVVILFGVLDAIQAHLTHRIYDLQNNKERLMPDVISDLKRIRIILVGEHHSNQNHHAAQVRVIQTLEASGGPGGYRARNVPQ